MPIWERSAQDAVEAEHPPPKESPDEPKFRSAWGPALILLSFFVVFVALAVVYGWSVF